MKFRNIPLVLITMVGAAGSTAAIAGSANDAVDNCVDAVRRTGAEVVDGNIARIKSRGASWEVWLNVDADSADLKVWCYSTRGQVKELVTQQGVWLGRNIRRPADEIRLAQNSGE